MPRFLPILPFLSILAFPAAIPAHAAETDDVASVKRCIAAAAARQDGAEICIGTLSDVCQKASDSAATPDMDDCIDREAKAWDALLNETYKSTMASAKALDAERRSGGDEAAEAGADLVKAQRAWIAYRDAECDRRFETYKDGTIRTTVHLSCTLDLTARRALDLAPEE